MAMDTYILKRIEMMEQELAYLKKLLLNNGDLKTVSLWGIWRGMDISDEEIEEAKRSLFKVTDQYS